MEGRNKWKILAITFLVTTIVAASFAGYYEYKAIVLEQKNVALEDLAIIIPVASTFRDIADLGYNYTYFSELRITGENLEKIEKKTMNMPVDALQFELDICWGKMWLWYHYYTWWHTNHNEPPNVEVSPETKVEMKSLWLLVDKLAERNIAISKMTEDSEKKEAFGELLGNTKKDFDTIADLLYHGQIQEAVEIAVNGEGKRYLEQPAYPIEVGVERDEYKIGENVTFWLKNNWDRTIELPAPSYAILEDVGHIVQTNTHGWSHRTEWKQIYEPNITQVIHLKPGERIEWTWDQKGNHTAQLADPFKTVSYKVMFHVTGWAEGTYSVHFALNINEEKRRGGCEE
ncbi:MAG: hypothetical protein U9O85_08485 [Euryarchaeota archaeon]|nr:hypothetical protein [Euryarchaeota archaeon]